MVEIDVFERRKGCPCDARDGYPNHSQEKPPGCESYCHAPYSNRGRGNVIGPPASLVRAVIMGTIGFVRSRRRA